MKLRQFMGGVVAATLGISGVAHAGQFSAEDLGQSLPMWMETLASINAHGDVAWTAWDGTATTATFYNAANDHVLSTTEAESWAVSISDHVIDGNETIVGIAGSQASSQRLTDRSAVLWRVSWPTSSGIASSQLLDLGATTDKLDGSEGTVQQSAAYAVLEKAGGGTARDFYVGGFARDKVNKSTFPQPVIWEISNAFTGNESIDVHPLPLINPNATVPSGYVASIAKNEEQGTIWACGNTSGAGDYNQATCWNLSGSIAGATVYTPMTTDLSSTAGLGAIPASSMVHRVRVVPIGPNGELHTVAVGSALMGSGSSRSWKGWAYDLDAGVLYKDLGLTGSTDHETFAYDVAALEYENGTATPSKGMIIAGISSSTAASDIGGLPGNIHNVPTTMRGVNRRMMLSGVTDTGQVCAIQDDSEDLQGTYQQLLALSADGRHRLATQGNRLVRLTAVVDEAEVEIRNRDARLMPHYYTPRTIERYYQAQLDPTHTAAAAQLRLAKKLACDQIATIGSGIGGPGAYDCDVDHPASYDIEDELVLNLSRSGSEPARSAKVTGELFDASDYNYAQIALRQGNDCTLTPVFSATTLTVQTNPPTDFDGKQWLECGGMFVDPQTDYEHCSGCGNVAELTETGLPNNRPLSQCLYGQCINGNVVQESDASRRYKANSCFINNQCWWQNDRNPNPSTTSYPVVNTRNAACGTSSTSPNYRDPCSVCNSSNPTQWSSSTNAMCCSNGTARLDAYDRNQTHCSGTDVQSYDRNDGRVRSARWKDPRPQWNYTQDDDWSSADLTECYAQGSGDPHSIITPGTVNGSYARPRRIDAFFTHPIDVEDWYEASFDDNGDSKPTPKPRARLISRKMYPGTSRRVRMRLCLYVDVANGSQGRVDIKDMRANAGINKTATFDGPTNTPAYDARGQCVDTDDNGVADIVVYDYDNTRNNKEDAYVHFVVRPLDDIANLHCDETLYTLYYGNDKRAGQSAQRGFNANKTGCLDCCN